jgi:hypothetical protein
VNLDKSEVSFSQNVLDADKIMTRNRMEVNMVDTHHKYVSQFTGGIWKVLEGYFLPCC